MMGGLKTSAWAWACLALVPWWPGLALPAGESGPAAEPGEERLAGQAASQALARISEAFRQQPCVRADVLSETDDELLGPQQEKGELILKRPDRLLRRFSGKSEAVKTMRLTGIELHEFSVTKKMVRVKDFSAAPRALALLRAALTLDAPALESHFALTVFGKPAAGQAPAQWRLVLARRPDAKSPLPYRLIQARLADGAPFFSEIEYVPQAGHGDRLVERYSQARAVKELTDADFSEPLLDNSPRETEAVKELE